MGSVNLISGAPLIEKCLRAVFEVFFMMDKTKLNNLTFAVLIWFVTVQWQRS